MANDIDFIGRDIGTPFNPNDALELRDWEDWTVPPTSGQIAVDLQGLVPNSRAIRMLDPALVEGLVLPGDIPPDPGNQDPQPEAFLLPTPDRVEPPGRFFSTRGLHDAVLNVPGLAVPIEMWTFRDNVTGTSSFPAPTIRCVEGDIVHTRMANRRGPHTIHHHGIEPTPMNDGVGHLTMDIGGGLSYDYQWLASVSGTYFYHCHVNTVLHFHMGMYGMLIIDPPDPLDPTGGEPSVDGEAGRVYVGNDIVNYDREAIWVAGDVDRRWHDEAQPGYSAAAGIEVGQFVPITHEENPRFHDFNPDVFMISGVAAPIDPNNQPYLISGAGATVQRGGRLLARVLNASYTTQVWRFPAALDGLVVGVDGRTIGRSGVTAFSDPFTLSSINREFVNTSAQRWDILIETAGVTPGTHLVEIEFRHWYDYNRILRTVQVPINITI